MPVFFISSGNIEGSTITLREPLSTHLQKSLRIRLRDRIRLCDEHRQRYFVEIVQIAPNHMVGEVYETQVGPKLELPRIILGQAILKGEKMTWVIQKGTELGVAGIVPVITDRVVTHLNSQQSQKYGDRWRRIALEAAQQAERWEVPFIAEPITAAKFWADQSYSAFNLILTERHNCEALSTIAFSNHCHDDLVIAVGPEGGWTANELLDAQKAGFKMVSLGDRILRAETASLAALSITQAQLGHLQ